MGAEEVSIPDREAVLAAEARIRDVIPETPLLRADDLGEWLVQPVWLKAESLQRTGSFKTRGATNWVRTATAQETAAGLITVSAGNHALALAWAAGQLGLRLTVVMPAGSSPIKVCGTRRLGAEVIVEGTIQEAVALAHRLRDERGLTLVHPYNDPRVMAGQATVGLELLRQAPWAARILCPVGGGGLISGIGIAVKTQRRDIELIGVEPAGAATMRHAWDRGTWETSLAGVTTMATSLAPVVVGAYTYNASRRYVDDIVTVSEEAIREATQAMLLRGRLYAEPGAAVGLAALLENAVARDEAKPTILIVTGANMDLEQAATLV